MVRRISFSQLQNQLRELDRRERQATDRYNQEVRRRNQKLAQAVNNYNREARAYNTRLRANRQRLQSALASLARQPVRTRYAVFRASVQAVSSAYMRLDQRAETYHDPGYSPLVDLAEREAANSVEVMNCLLGRGAAPDEPVDMLVDARLTNELKNVSEDLDDRWRGAVFALSPHNPDAARHFCTSAREIIAQILEMKAPDTKVIAAMPHCDRTDRGKPTRRAKIGYFLQRKDMGEEALEEFIEQDIQNIVDLFGIFNAATHGSAGTFDLYQLGVIRKRVEDGLFFLSRLIN